MPTSNANALADASALLAERIGLDTGALGTALLAQLLEQRVQELLSKHGIELDGTPAYVAYLRQDAAEQARLIQAVLVTESWFERDSAQLDAFSRKLPRLMTLVAEKRRIKVLCAPCSHGEEPFSLAARLWEHGLNSDSAEVLALDLSNHALAQARQAHYTDSAWRSNLTLPWWLTRDSAGVIKVDARLQKMVRFDAANLLQADDLLPAGPFDAVFSRNFLIYLTPAARTLWLGRIAGRLAAHGWAYSGPAESFHQWSRDFAPAADSGHAYVYALAKSQVKAVAKPTVKAVVRPAAFQPTSKPVVLLAAQSVAPPTSVKSSVKSNVKPSLLLTPSVSADPLTGDPHALLQERAQIRRLADTGQFIEASTQLAQALAARTPQADDFLLTALIALAQANRSNAEVALERALFLEPRHAEALEHLAALRELAGRASEALQLRKRIDRLGSRNAALSAPIEL